MTAHSSSSALEDMEAMDARLRCSYYHCLIAERLLAAGDAGTSNENLRQAESLLAASDERWAAAEIYRMRGLLELTQSDDAATADAHLKAAQATAADQSARAFELKAATSRARLLRTQGRAVEARQILAPICGWFTEGLDTPDLKEAKALLDELS